MVLLKLLSRDAIDVCNACFNCAIDLCHSCVGITSPIGTLR
jgi:hypothetical protein